MGREKGPQGGKEGNPPKLSAYKARAERCREMVSPPESRALERAQCLQELWPRAPSTQLGRAVFVSPRQNASLLLLRATRPARTRAPTSSHDLLPVGLGRCQADLRSKAPPQVTFLQETTQNPSSPGVCCRVFPSWLGSRDPAINTHLPTDHFALKKPLPEQVKPRRRSWSPAPSLPRCLLLLGDFTLQAASPASPLQGANLKSSVCY